MIKDLFFKFWSINEVNTCRLGGNAAFFEHMSGFKLEQSLIAKKYQSQGATQYKNNLALKVKGQDAEDKPKK